LDFYQNSQHQSRQFKLMATSSMHLKPDFTAKLNKNCAKIEEVTSERCSSQIEQVT